MGDAPRNVGCPYIDTRSGEQCQGQLKFSWHYCEISFYTEDGIPWENCIEFFKCEKCGRKFGLVFPKWNNDTHVSKS